MAYAAIHSAISYGINDSRIVDYSASRGSLAWPRLHFEAHRIESNGEYSIYSTEVAFWCIIWRFDNVGQTGPRPRTRLLMGTQKLDIYHSRDSPGTRVNHHPSRGQLDHHLCPWSLKGIFPKPRDYPLRRSI
jgi:hypothetical protein